MNDVFKEQLVSKDPKKLDLLIRGGLVLVGTLWLVLMRVTVQMFWVRMGLDFAMLYGIYMLLQKITVEYEYIITNGDFDVDIIYNRKKRKKLLNVSLRGIELMIPYSEVANNPGMTNVKDKLDLTNGKDYTSAYVFLNEHEGKLKKVIIEPNEELLFEIKRVLGPIKFMEKRI